MKTGATANAAVLNHCAVERWPAGSSGSPTRFGRCVPNPANALKFVVCVTATGSPDCRVTTVASVQSLASAPAMPAALMRPSVAHRELPHRRGDEHVRDVAGRIVALETRG